VIEDARSLRSPDRLDPSGIAVGKDGALRVANIKDRQHRRQKTAHSFAARYEGLIENIPAHSPLN